MLKTLQHQNTQLLFGNQLNDTLNKVIATHFKNAKVIIISDENVYELWIEDLIYNTPTLFNAEIIQLPAGEDTKSVDFCYQAWETLADYKVKRGDLIINFGGGVTTDFGGFIASTFKRGVHFINIPTTLLAQIDASVGGKTGINLGHQKNLIGTFSLADYVFIDDKYLLTLSYIELLSGFAEMLKHGLIYDKSHWNNLIGISKVNVSNISPFIYDSVNIKHQIVTQDPKEKDIRKLLNFGHTIGHAIEGVLLTENIPYPHGYAVAWGMIIEAELSFELNLLSKDELNQIKKALHHFYIKCPIKKTQINQLVELMLNDKKNTNPQINFTLLKEIGKGEINQLVDIDVVENVLKRSL